MSEVLIAPARGAAQLADTKRLFLAYADWLGFSLDFQDFDAELAALPGAYAPPLGEIWLAHLDGKAVGCVAVRPLDDGAAELKRLYVAPAGRGRGLGRRLVVRAIVFAARAGFRALKLDTLGDGRMEAAGRLYRSLGFEPCEKYNDNPLEAAEFLSLDLLLLSQGSGGA